MQAKSQKQKKVNSILFIVAIILFGAVLVSSALVAGTFAKYTTNGSGSDGATVAKWGIAVGTTTSSVFSTSYSNGTDIIVASGNTPQVNIVAPTTSSTSGSVMTFNITGTAEVAVKVTIQCKVTYGTAWSTDVTEGSTTYDISKYRPVQFASGATAVSTTYATIYEETFAPNATLTDANSVALAWAWLYEQSAASVVTTYAGGANTTAAAVETFDLDFFDHMDTLMAIAANTNAASTAITLDYIITVEQVNNL